jgi:hypothetical protein
MAANKLPHTHTHTHTNPLCIACTKGAKHARCPGCSKDGAPLQKYHWQKEAKYQWQKEVEQCNPHLICCKSRAAGSSSDPPRTRISRMALVTSADPVVDPYAAYGTRRVPLEAELPSSDDAGRVVLVKELAGKLHPRDWSLPPDPCARTRCSCKASKANLGQSQLYLHHFFMHFAKVCMPALCRNAQWIREKHWWTSFTRIPDDRAYT